MKGNINRTIVWILASLCVVNTVFIFSNSIPSIPESRETSEKILEFVEPILDDLIKEEYVTNHVIRKCAHVLEYFCLGVLLTLFFRYVNKTTLWGCYVGLQIAVIDETIQLFSKRGAQLQDIWLDYLSVIIAIIIAWGVRKICGYCTKKLGERIDEKAVE